MRTRERRSASGVPAGATRRRRRHDSRRLVLGSLVGVATLLIAACGSNSSGGSSPSGGGSSSRPAVSATGETKKGGEVTMLLTGMGGRFDPVSAPAFGFVTGGPMNAIYGNMTYVDPSNNEIKMGFLQSLEHNADYTVWTGKLTPGLKFSDGTPFDAEAVVFNLKRFADSTTGSLFVKSASDITPAVVDATTFTMTLKKANVHFDAVYAENFSYVGSPTAIKAAGSNFATQPVGAGPFKVQNIDGTNSVTLIPNPNWALFKPDEPRLDKVTFQVIADFPKEAQALASNQAQMAAPYGGDATEMFKKLPNVTVQINQTGAGSNLQMSEKRPPFNDVRAREAIELALDRSALANAFHPGTDAQTNLFPDKSPNHNPAYDFPKQDKAKAQQLFDQLAAEGKPVNFDYIVPDQTQTLIFAQLLKSQLSAYKNVKMNIKSMTTAQYITNQRGGTYQMAPVGLYLINPIPELELFYTTGGSLNTFGYSNPKVDAAFQDLHTQADPQKQIEDYGIIQKEVLNDHVTYWIGKGILGFAYNKDLLNVVPANYGIAPLWGALGYKK